jgi:hypothetical protein
LVVRYDTYRLQHVYLVYAVGTDEISSFDSIHGTRRFHTCARALRTSLDSSIHVQSGAAAEVNAFGQLVDRPPRSLGLSVLIHLGSSLLLFNIVGNQSRFPGMFW